MFVSLNLNSNQSSRTNLKKDVANSAIGSAILGCGVQAAFCAKDYISLYRKTPLKKLFIQESAKAVAKSSAYSALLGAGICLAAGLINNKKQAKRDKLDKQA